MDNVKKNEKRTERENITDLILECKNITHNYGQVQALSNIDLTLRKGEILGVVGDNGAGKSTLIKILRGVLKPTAGHIYISGEEKTLHNPRDAVRYGIQCVYQEQALIEQLSIAENFFLGQEPTKGRKKSYIKLIDYNKMIKESSHFLRNIGLGEDLAILDRHILRKLLKANVIEKMPGSMSEKRYLEIEGRMRRFANEIGIPLSHLDIVIWYSATGSIFK